MIFLDSVLAEVAKEYPDVKTASYLVDAASYIARKMALLKRFINKKHKE